VAPAAQTTLAGDSVHAAKTLFTWRDGVLAAGFTGLTFAMYPADKSFASRLQDSSTQANHFLENAAKGIQYFADPGSIVIGVSLYTVGRIAKWRDVADLGLHRRDHRWATHGRLVALTSRSSRGSPQRTSRRASTAG
jgi:hypothetical protein